MKTIKLYLDTEGNLTCSQDLSNLTQYTFQENLLSVCVPKEIVENQDAAVSVVFSSQDKQGELETESYNMQYVKDIVSDSAEYYLYSRLSPKRMTLYSGSQQLAININYFENGACISRTTSQRLAYNVIASDYDLEPKEINDKDNLQSQIDTINQKLDSDYQTKVDTSIKVASDNDSTKYDSDFVNTVVGALTKLDSRVKEHQKYLFDTTYDSSKGTIESRIDTNEKDIDTNEQSIENHETRITALESKISEFFHFLGSFEYDYEGEPTDTDLDNALTEKEHTTKHIGDCLLAISTYGSQDTLYICIWNGSAWAKQNVVGIQKANDDNYGVIKGNSKVKIASGQVQNIYIATTYGRMTLEDFGQDVYSTLYDLRDDIYLETSRAKNVEKTLTAKDTDLQNQINETKTDLEENYVKETAMIDYCLPRVFNDTYYVNYKTMTLENELTDTSTMISVATGTTEVGTFSYAIDTFEFELSRRNNLSLRLYFNDNDSISKTIKLSITLNAYLNKNGNETQLCTYTKDFTFDDNNITSIDLDTTLNSLKDNVLKVESNDIITLKLSISNDYSNTFTLGLYSNTSFASTFTFNTDFKNIAFTKGQVGEIPTLYLKYDSDNSHYVAYKDSEYSKVASVNTNIMYDLKFISIDTLESDLTNNVKTQITYDTQTLECLLKSNGNTFTNAALLSLIANGDRILTLFNGSAFELVDSAIYNLKQDLNNEKTTRANNDTQIQTNLSKEIQERKESDTSLQGNIDKKQDKLTAGVGIEIENNVISVLGYHYSKFVFEGTSALLTSVSGECAIAFDSSTQSVDMEKMINIYPFNQIKREEIQLYKDSALTTQLSGKDMFITFPNLYWCATIGGDSQTLTFEFANYKVNDKFHRVYEDNSINKCGIACYLATEDTSDSSNKRLRSNTTTNNGIFKVNMNQATCENELPYLSNGDKADMLDSRVWFAYSALAQCFIGARNGQKKYYGLCGWGTSTWNYESDLNGKVKEANLYGTWIAGSCDTLAQTSTMTGEITTWTENDVTTEIASGKRPFIVLGVENPYGLLWQNLGGIYHTDQNLYQYQATKHKSNSSFNTSDCELIGTDLCGSEGWQLKFNQNNGVVYPISVGGNDSTTCGDYYWYGSGDRIYFVGGNWSRGSACGFSCLVGHLGFGSATTHIGFRLSIKM